MKKRADWIVGMNLDVIQATEVRNHSSVKGERETNQILWLESQSSRQDVYVYVLVSLIIRHPSASPREMINATDQ